jgi:fructosamine-3-kinase
MNPRQRALARAVEAQLGSAVVEVAPVGGGDINDASRARLADGRVLFIKTHARPPRGMFSREAEGLRWLADAGAPLRIAQVVASSDGENGEPAFLALEWVESAPRARDHDESLGQGLAALHRCAAPSFGFAHDNFIGVLPQQNAPEPDWPSFYEKRRLMPQLALAIAGGHASAAMRAGIERVCARLPELCGPPEPPARLHGDLWGGNAIADEQGQPVLIDPAVYGGHREVDLAMMRLFGGFGARCFAAYNEAYPLATGHAERVALYQLYPLLVHVNLFGGAYLSSVQGALAQLIDQRPR